MIEMEMGEHERIKLPPIKRYLSQTAKDTAAAVNQHEPAVFFEQIPRLRPLGIGDHPSGA
jgi:hypothetical protein